jgi:nitrogen fixation protein NifZ
MGLGREEEIEIYKPPVFKAGSKVYANRQVKNDGTMAGREIGEVVVKKGDVGYVRDIGMYLQRYYVYAVEFIDRGSVVGMRGRELGLVETKDATP